MKNKIDQIIKESIDKVLSEGGLGSGRYKNYNKIDLYRTFRNQAKTITQMKKNPYRYAYSPKELKELGYDENGLKNGKKYYDDYINMRNDSYLKQIEGRPMFIYDGSLDSKTYDRIHNTMANMEKKELERRDKQWKDRVDKGPLYGKKSINNDIPKKYNK